MLVLLWEPGVADMVRFQAQAQELSLETQTSRGVAGRRVFIKELRTPQRWASYTPALSISGNQGGKAPQYSPSSPLLAPTNPHQFHLCLGREPTLVFDQELPKHCGQCPPWENAIPDSSSSCKEQQGGRDSWIWNVHPSSHRSLSTFVSSGVF